MAATSRPKATPKRAVAPAPEEPARMVLRHNSAGAIAITFILTVGLALGAFVLSFEALQQLAEVSNITLAWIWPLIIDGFIITATIASYVLRERKRVAWYAWASLILFAGASISGNAVHAFLSIKVIKIPVWSAALVNAAPAIALLIASHLLVIMLSTPRPPKPKKQETPQATTAPSALPLTTTAVSTRPAPVGPHVPVTAVPMQTAEPVSRTVTFHPQEEEAVPALETMTVHESTVDGQTSAEPKTDEDLLRWVKQRIAEKKVISARTAAGFLGEGIGIRTAAKRLEAIRESDPEIGFYLP